MADLLWESIWLPVLAGIGLSLLVECRLKPGTEPFWRRPAAALSIHAGLWLLAFAFELAVFRRPWFSMTIVLAFLFLVVLVSNAKWHSLREPFIFQDFEYFIDTLKHPRLYLPFFGKWKALLATVGFGAVLFAGLTLEPSLTVRVSSFDFIILLVFVVFIGVALVWLGAMKKLPVAFDPETDVSQLGLMTSLWRYGEEERRPCHISSQFDHPGRIRSVSANSPNLVVVQSESFFDVRDVFAGIRPDVLHEYDIIKDSAVSWGKLGVPAWGANTVRTEFAFLSGLGAEKLGVHRFNPYRKLAKQGIATLASLLNLRGYRTVCVHPYHAGFYARNKVFPLLGFDEFIDIRSFDETKKSGPYIGDVALAEKVCALLESSSTQPVFVFAITMENHGPLHWEKVLAGDEARLYSNPPPDGCDDLTIYLRHLRNADRMAGILRDRLETLGGSSRLCWFGDHLPIMPEVYGALGVPDGQTDYLIWRKGGEPGKGIRRDLKIENLSHLLLEEMGFISAANEDDPTRRRSQSSF